MPRPVPLPIRQKRFDRFQDGESVPALATAFGLPARTVRERCSRFRDPPGQRTLEKQAHAGRVNGTGTVAAVSSRRPGQARRRPADVAPGLVPVARRPPHSRDPRPWP